MLYTARTDSGKIVEFTFRNLSTNAAFVRVNGKTVSGHVHYVPELGYKFHPTGKNKGLVK